jgi:ABC-type arginine transport system permease subunit
VRLRCVGKPRKKILVKQMMDTLKGIIKGVFSLIFLLVVLFGCSPKAATEIEKTESTVSIENIDFDLSMISIVGDIQPFNSEIRIDTLG